MSILKGVQTFRNLGLVNDFYKLGFIVNYGTGSVRIREAYAGKVLQLEFKVIDRYFFVTIPNLNYHANELEMGIVEENVGEKPYEEMLIDLLKNNPNVSQREIAMAIGKFTKGVERILKSSHLD